jgi:hypothetical protein
VNCSKFAKRGLAAKLAAKFEGHLPGRLNFYDGQQPRSPDVAVDQQVLATLYFRSPTFGVGADGTLTAHPLDPRCGFLSAMPEWARVLDGDGQAWFDVSCGLAGSGADLILDAPIREGEPLEITKLAIDLCPTTYSSR